MIMMWLARGIAAVISVSTFVFLFLHDSWRADNIFLVPDLILCALLLLAAVLPNRIARPALVAAFAYSAGVLGVSVSSYATRGELGVASLIGFIACAAGAVVMTVGLASESRDASTAR